MIEFFIAAFMSLFTIINPFSTASVFVSITRWNSHDKKLDMAKRACFTATAVLIIFSFAGASILEFFSISIDAFRIAGGILLTLTAINMLKDNGVDDTKVHKEAIKKDDVAIIPLAIPLLSGPGAITTTIVLTSQTTNYLDFTAILIAIMFIMILSYIVLRNADTIVKYLGHTGNDVLDKIMGLIVLAIGIQFIMVGFTAFFI